MLRSDSGTIQYLFCLCWPARCPKIDVFPRHLRWKCVRHELCKEIFDRIHPVTNNSIRTFPLLALFQTTTWACFRLEIMVVDHVTYVSWRCGVVRYVLVVPLTKEIPIHCAAYHLDLLYIFC